MKTLIKSACYHLERLFDRKCFLIICALGISFFWSIQCSVSLIHKGKIGIDSAVFRYVAYAMSKGQMPYKDIFDHKGPLIYLINYLGYLVSGDSGVYVFEYLALLATTVFCFLIAKRTCHNNMLASLVTFISLAPLATYLDGGNYTEEYAMPLIAVSLYIFLGYFQDSETTDLKILVCGLCGGCVLMLRPNMAVTWLVFPIFVIINQVSKNKTKELVKECII